MSKVAHLGATASSGCADGGCASGGKNTSTAAGPPAKPSRGDVDGGGGIESMGANLVTTARCGRAVTGVPGMGSRGVL